MFTKMNKGKKNQPARTIGANTKVEEGDESPIIKISIAMLPTVLTHFKKVLLPFNILILLFNIIGIKGGKHKSKDLASMLVRVNNNGLKQMRGTLSTNNGTLKIIKVGKIKMLGGKWRNNFFGNINASKKYS